MRFWRILLPMVCLFSAVAVAAAEDAIPVFDRRVIDLTGTLSASQTGELEGVLAQYEHEKGSQIAVLIVGTTEPDSLEEYSLKAAERWKGGRKGIDDGVLLLVVKNDRRVRIEVGYGLEGALPDAICKRIISDIMVPEFREQRFFLGIQKGLDAVIGSIKGEPLPVPKSGILENASGAGFFIVLVMIVLAASFFLKKVYAVPTAAGLVFVAASIEGLPLPMKCFLAMFAAGAAGGGVKTGSAGWSSGGGGFSGGYPGGGGSFGGGGASGSW